MAENEDIEDEGDCANCPDRDECSGEDGVTEETQESYEEALDHTRLHVWVVVIEEDSIQGKSTTVSNVFFDLEDAEQYISFRYPLAKKEEDGAVTSNKTIWKHALWVKGSGGESTLRQATIITVHKMKVVEDLKGPPRERG